MQKQQLAQAWGQMIQLEDICPDCPGPSCENWEEACGMLLNFKLIK